MHSACPSIVDTKLDPYEYKIVLCGQLTRIYRHFDISPCSVPHSWIYEAENFKFLMRSLPVCSTRDLDPLLSPRGKTAVGRKQRIFQRIYSSWSVFCAVFQCRPIYNWIQSNQLAWPIRIPNHHFAHYERAGLAVRFRKALAIEMWRYHQHKRVYICTAKGAPKWVKWTNQYRRQIKREN